MSVTEDVEVLKRVSDQTNIYRLDRGTNNMGIFQGVVVAVQEHYRVHSVIPSVEIILKTVPSTKGSISKILGSEGFAKSMEMRGIPLTSSAGLSPSQSILLSVLTNPADRRTLQAKLKQVGISYHVYRNWLKQPHFHAAVSRESEELLRVHTGDVLTQLTSKAVAGDLNAIKMYLEVNGRHDPGSRQTVDVIGLMNQILEVISRRVSDPGVLAAIAGDFELLSAGRAVSESVATHNETVQGQYEVGPSATPNLNNSPSEPIRPEPRTPEEWLAANAPTPVGLDLTIPILGD